MSSGNFPDNRMLTISLLKNSLSLSLSEAASNAMVHGNKLDPNKYVDIKITVSVLVLFIESFSLLTYSVTLLTS